MLTTTILFFFASGLGIGALRIPIGAARSLA